MNKNGTVVSSNRDVSRASSYADTKGDDFPTPPWVTRALIEYVVPELVLNKRFTIRDPAAGRGHIVQTLRKLKFYNVYGNDIRDYKNKVRGYRPEREPYDYLRNDIKRPRIEFLITNPPGKLATAFTVKMLSEATRGVAVLCPTMFAEGGREHARSRWQSIFKLRPPTRIAIVSARMPAAHGKVVRNRPVFRSHSWFYWDLTCNSGRTEFRWIPPEAQRLLERSGDYD